MPLVLSPPTPADSVRSELPHRPTPLRYLRLHTERVNDVGKKSSILLTLCLYHLHGGLWPDAIGVPVIEH